MSITCVLGTILANYPCSTMTSELLPRCRVSEPPPPKPRLSPSLLGSAPASMWHSGSGMASDAGRGLLEAQEPSIQFRG